MAKGRKGSKENPVTLEDMAAVAAAVLNISSRDYIVTEAAIKDDFCNYTYEITAGVGISNTHTVKGKHIILDDMRTAFAQFNVHLAVLDDAFKIAGIEIGDIDQFHGDDITGRYVVTGFKIKGGKDNESISLVGTKYSYTAGGRMAITTPFIALDNLSSYKWYNEFRDAAGKAREEVALYQEGKFRMVETDDDDEEGDGKKRKARQLTIASPEGVAETPEPVDIEGDAFDDFEGARR